MRKIFLVCVALAGLSAGRANAADIPAYPAIPAPLPVVGIADCWSGFYVGGTLGYHGGEDDLSTSANWNGWGALGAAYIDSQSATFLGPHGAALGGQIGSNWQVNNVVFGWEADAQWLGGAASRQYTYPTALFGFPGSFMYNSSAANVVATLRPRLGVAFDNLLVYGTGGLAVGWFSNTDSFSLGGAILSAQPSTTTRLGWTGGGGLEWKFLPAWSVKAEYLYLHMQNYNVTIPDIAAIPFTDIAVHHNYTDNLFRLGVNWHVSPW